MMGSRWRLVEGGEGGASWFSFKRRVWERNLEGASYHRLVLLNLTNLTGYQNRGTVYQAVIYTVGSDGNHELHECVVDSSHIELIRRMKERYG